MDSGQPGWWRVPRVALRAGWTAVVAVVLLAPVVGGSAVVGGLLGAGLGVVLGEALAATRLRLPVALGLALATGLAGVLAGWLCLASAAVASLLGPPLALSVAGLLVASVGLGGVVAGLRVAARRVPALALVELAALALALTLPFVAHRGGDLARPLWLADAAWALGFDPADVLLAIGALAGAGLATAQLLETRHRLPRLGWVWIPVVALLAFLVADARTSEAPEADALRDVQEGSDYGPPASGGEGAGDAQADAGEQGGERTEGDGPPEGGASEGEGGTSEGEGGTSEGEGGASDGEGGASEGDADGGGSGDGQASAGRQDLSEQPPEDAESPKNVPVAVVLLGDDLEPVAGYYYLRQIVQSELAGHRLVAATKPELDRDVLTRFPVKPTWVSHGPPQEGRKKVHGRVALLAEHDAPFALDAVLSYEPAPNPDATRFIRAWKFVSLAPQRPFEDYLGLGAGRLEPDALAHYLTYPAADPRYLELATSLLTDVPAAHRADPFVRALAVKRHLDQMRYTRKRRHADAPDPTASFLFGDLTGYCVHAAHAAVYLMRALGVPSRIGTGYAVEADRRRGSSIVVMGADAHAWPEIYLAGEGWVILDISPSEDLDAPGEPMDEAMTALLAEMARDTDASEPQAASLRWLWALAARTLARVLLALGALVLLLHYAAKLWRRARVWTASARGLPRVGYRVALDRLSEAGFVREPGETRERFARRVAPVAPSFETLTALHLRARLGRPDAPPTPGVRWRALLASLRGELRGVALWRRLLGLLDPTSFYRSR